MRDEKLMEDALEKFQSEAKSKFMKGILEHNPNGDKGLSRMHLLQKIDACKEEVIDLWFYLYAMEQDICERRQDH
jgi:hypothetical protein